MSKKLKKLLVRCLAEQISLHEAWKKTRRFPSVTGVEITSAAEIPSLQATTINTDRRRRTGRNQQLNMKVSEDVSNRLYALAQEFDQPLGLVLERAVKALEANKTTF